MSYSQHTRKCPDCGNYIFYSTRKILLESIRSHRMCKKCSQKGNRSSNFGKSLPTYVKNKISMSEKGKKMSIESCQKMSESHTGLKCSIETKHKHRIITLEKVKKLGGFPKYNPNACKFIDNINKCIGLNLQHALNGGEVKLYGYMVDGYDKEKNIIFEYDEPGHNRRWKQKKDIIRQETLIKKICPVLFLRYDESSQRLYDVITSSNIEVC